MKVGVKASGLWWWERGWDLRPGWAPFSWGRAHLGGGLRLAELHWICVGSWSRILLDALKEGGKFGVGSDLGREVSHDGAFPHFWDGQQGGHCSHGRALQFILLLELLLHRTSFDLKWETTMSHPLLSLSLHHSLASSPPPMALSLASQSMVAASWGFPPPLGFLIQISFKVTQRASE